MKKSKGNNNWYAVLGYYRIHYPKILKNVDLLSQIGKNNIKEQKDKIKIICPTMKQYNLLIRELGNPLCKRINESMRNSDLFVIWPLEFYQKLSRSEERNLINKGVEISIHEDKVHFEFPNEKSLSQFRKDTLCPSSHIIDNLLFLKHEKKNIYKH